MTETQWDAIVIGAGMGGMTAAAYLAAAGRRTLLIEQHSVLGGCSHVFRREKKWEFEVGVHYIGDCGPHGQVPTLLRGLALDERIEFLPLDPHGFDRLCFPGLTLAVPVGWARYLEQLIGACPADERGLRRCVGVLRRLAGRFDRSRSPTTHSFGLVDVVRSAGFDTRWAMRPLTELLDACALSPRARALLTAQWIAYACPPSRAPALLHASYLENYVGRGAFYPRGGGQMLAAQLADVVRTHGGGIRLSTRVSRIVVTGGRVTGVELEGGERLRTGNVISGADLRRTMLGMVGAEHLSRRSAERLHGYTMAAPFVNLYLGLDLDLRQRMPRSNLLAMPSWDEPDHCARALTSWQPGQTREGWLRDAEQRLMAFVHSSDVKDPAFTRYAPAGCSTLEVMTIVPSAKALWGDWSADAGSHAYKGDASYQELKQRVTEILLQRAEQVLPGVTRHVVWSELGTPRTHQRYTLSSEGGSYGIELNARQIGPRRPRSRTEIGGLLLAGASTAWGPGIEGTMLSGMHAASTLLERDLHAELRQGLVLADRRRLSPQESLRDPLRASSVNHATRERAMSA
jgi:all-trans-retinol 13,14-reductase